MYNQILHCDRKHFCYYCLQSLVAQKYKKRHTKDCFEIFGKQMIKMLKKGKQLNLKIMGGKKN